MCTEKTASLTNGIGETGLYTAEKKKWNSILIFYAAQNIVSEGQRPQPDTLILLEEKVGHMVQMKTF